MAKEYKDLEAKKQKMLFRRNFDLKDENPSHGLIHPDSKICILQILAVLQ
jgi:hypothetical protein